MIPQLSFLIMMKAPSSLNRDEQILRASEPKQSCVTAWAHPRLTCWPLRARVITEDSPWSSHYRPSGLTHSHPRYEKQLSLHWVANTAHHILPPQAVPFSYQFKQWHSDSAQPELPGACPADTGAEPVRTPPELPHPLPCTAQPHRLTSAPYGLVPAGSVGHTDQPHAPCALQYPLIFSQCNKPHFLPWPRVCPGPLRPQAVHCTLCFIQLIPPQFINQLPMKKHLERQCWWCELIPKAGESHNNKFYASLVYFQQPSLFLFLRYVLWLANTYLLCVMPPHPVSVSVSVSKLFTTFLGLCHPLWIRRNWCSVAVLRPHALTLSLPLLFAMTCTILVSLLQSDLHIHYRGQPCQYKAFQRYSKWHLSFFLQVLDYNLIY